MQRAVAYVDLISGWSLRGIDTTSLCNTSSPNESMPCTLNMCAWGEGRVGIYEVKIFTRVV